MERDSAPKRERKESFGILNRSAKYRIHYNQPSYEVCLKCTLNECVLAGDENTILD